MQKKYLFVTCKCTSTNFHNHFPLFEKSFIASLAKDSGFTLKKIIQEANNLEIGETLDKS
jgi:hypothetical protein